MFANSFHRRQFEKISHARRRKKPLPSFEFVKRRAAQLGGAPDRHTRLPLFLVALLHGTAPLLHSLDAHKKIARDFRHTYISACRVLIHAASPKLLRPKRSSPPRRKPLPNR